ncbi:hypothetical protein ZOSMA_132G00020 [Zostera marina]|uniref:Uncharacterized protein n=1 Tax=Zostera marina TaxID=29655 RepID=A0A0K9PZ92_ZOSMR|nr:hypothetical protein ZOSMA_132G00020 [Zostera marina]
MYIFISIQISAYSTPHVPSGFLHIRGNHDLMGWTSPQNRCGHLLRLPNFRIDLTILGMDLTILGLNLNSTGTLYKTFGSPWSEEPLKGDPEYSVPSCYFAKQPPPLQKGHFSKFQLETLFYIFYSMPKDEAQLYSAHELTLKEMKNRGLKPNTRAYNAMIGGFSQLGWMDEARTMFDEAKKTHSKLGRFSYHILIQKYIQMGEFEDSLRCFYEMKEDEIELDADDYRKLIVSLCQKSLDCRTAQKLLKEMQDDEVQVNRRTRRLVAMGRWHVENIFDEAC